MNYPKLNIILHMVKNGYECDENDIDDVTFNKYNIKYLKNYPFDGKCIMDWFGDFNDDIDEDSYKYLISENIFTLDKFLEIYDEWYDLNISIIEDIENISYLNKYDVENISDEHIKVYLKYNEHDQFVDDEIHIAMLKRILSVSEYYDKVFKGELAVLDEDEIVEFFQRPDFDGFSYLTKEIILSDGFLNSFDNFPRKGNCSYANYIESKHELAFMIWDYFGYDDDIKAAFLNKLSYVYDEHLETEDERADRLAKKEEYNKIENVIARAKERNRIQADDANRIIKEVYNLENYINVHDGHVGLEDMTFSTIHIKGEIFEYNEAFGRHWINGRNFGDNLISYDQFERAIKYAQSLKDNKE